ncbi:hypothetical protein FB45DRAFT_1038311 [Roridomyces roridus]|uniref:C2H2-type domain-containing protein n=1 Tax=Roridomyces roridus TaxID=1738132 RepID=A0AAD7B3R6_9AGAR|nr:hypothetical protein FB45DRAFT_1038311 [Roridomyces roridus]
MSFSLPMAALANMQISFKVGLPDGLFAFEMLPSVSGNHSAVDPSFNASGMGGMKLHVLTSHDFSGVTLTLFASGGDTPLPSVQASVDVGASTSAMPSPTPMDDLYLHNFVPSPSPFATSYCESSSSDPSLLDGTSGQSGFDDFLDTFSRDSTATTPSDSPAAPLRGMSSPSSPDASLDSNKFEDLEQQPQPTWMAVTSSAPDLTPVPSSPPRSRGRGQGRHHKFPCTMGCRMDFSRKHDRLRHEVAQHGRLCEWECSSCQGFFSSDVTFKKHRCKAVAVGRRVGDREASRELVQTQTQAQTQAQTLAPPSS